MDSTSKRQQERGHVSRRRTHPGIFDNSTESRSVQRAIGRHVRFIGKPGRALSGNPAVAALPQPPNDLDFRTLLTSSFRIFAQTDEPAIRGAEECLQLQGDGRIRRKPAPWHGSCQTWPNQ